MIPENWRDGKHISSVRSDGTLIYGNNLVTNGTVVVYTVGAGVEVLLSYFYLTGHSHADGLISLAVYDAVPALLYYLDEIDLHTNGHDAVVTPMFPSLLIPTGYSVRLTSSAVNVDAKGGILGYSYPIN